jgi:hypothetical protein
MAARAAGAGTPAALGEQLTPTNLGELIERSGSNTFVLFALYAVSLVFAARRLSLLLRVKREWDAPLMFVGSIVFSLSVRTLSFGTLAVLAFRNVDVDGGGSGGGGGGGGTGGGGNPGGSDQLFIQRCMAVLFNVADWSAVSTYSLLGVVWMELLVSTRRHFYSPEATQRRWLLAYLVANTALYCVQIGLYVAVFATPSDPDALLAAVYRTLGVLNAVLPATMAGSWLLYQLMFAGFPYRSEDALARWRRLTRLVVGWTVARVGWATASLLAATPGVLDAVADAGSWAFTAVCLSLFLLGELVPYLASLGTDVLRLFGPLRDGEEGEGDGGAAAGDDDGDGAAARKSGSSGDEEGEEEPAQPPAPRGFVAALRSSFSGSSSGSSSGRNLLGAAAAAATTDSFSVVLGRGGGDISSSSSSGAGGAGGTARFMALPADDGAVNDGGAARSRLPLRGPATGRLPQQRHDAGSGGLFTSPTEGTAPLHIPIAAATSRRWQQQQPQSATSSFVSAHGLDGGFDDRDGGAPGGAGAIR